ncbi:MAG: glycosyltransferase family 4 protein [Gammaproteobacteria bacterium]|nr:glycosyltransferase family 4 protein [Gammaproteobacteria bacterium]
MKKIAIATVQVPFITGGAEIHAKLLQQQLIKRGYLAEIVSHPFKWYPEKTLLQQLSLAQKIDLTEVAGQTIDQVISLKFPSYYCQANNKVGWILHQHRQAYDLYKSNHSDLHKTLLGRYATYKIKQLDNHYLGKLSQQSRLFTNAQNVADRLKRYNNIAATALYHPPENYQQLYSSGSGDYILVPGRIEELKRQQLIIQALALSKSKHKLILIGQQQTDYAKKLQQLVQQSSLGHQVIFKGFVSQQEKIDLYANAKAVYNGAQDEDYGYVTLEAFYARKPVITHTDSGGPLEFVRHHENGYIVAPDAQILAELLNLLDNNNPQLSRYGENGYQQMLDLKLNWDHIIDQLILD